MDDSNLLRFTWDKKRWLVFDYETSGLNTRFSLPFELSWDIYEKGKLVSSHCHYIYDKDFKIDPKVAAINHYDSYKVKREGKTAKEVTDLFDKELYSEDTYNLGANILNYDIFIHNATRNRVGLKTDFSYLARSYDTNSLAKAYRKKIQVDHSDILAWQFRMQAIVEKGLKTGVDSMTKEFDIPVDESRRHTAQYDNFLTMAIFQKLIWHIEI